MSAWSYVALRVAVLPVRRTLRRQLTWSFHRRCLAAISAIFQNTMAKIGLTKRTPVYFEFNLSRRCALQWIPVRETSLVKDCAFTAPASLQPQHLIQTQWQRLLPSREHLQVSRASYPAAAREASRRNVAQAETALLRKDLSATSTTTSGAGAAPFRRLQVALLISASLNERRSTRCAIAALQTGERRVQRYALKHTTQICVVDLCGEIYFLSAKLHHTDLPHKLVW